MDNLQGIQLADSILQGLVGLAGALIGVTRFLFMTVWGWIILILMLVLTVIARSRNAEGEITLSRFLGGFGEIAFWFYSNMVSVIVGIVIVLLLATVYRDMKTVSESLTLYRDVKMLESAMRNLKADRKLLEVTAVPVMDNTDERKIKVRLKYFSYSPVKEADVPGGEAEFTIPGRKLYVDFCVLNFDYALIEKGLAFNIAFPNRLFSESVAPTNGLSLLEVRDGLPLTFRLDENDLYLLGIQEYKTEIGLLIGASTNAALARKMGLRSYYGAAVGMLPDPDRTYRIYSTGTGGVILR